MTFQCPVDGCHGTLRPVPLASALVCDQCRTLCITPALVKPLWNAVGAKGVKPLSKCQVCGMVYSGYGHQCAGPQS